MKNLLSCKRGAYYIVSGISDAAPFKIKRRLLELGFTKGVKARVVRTSLIGQAYLIELRGFTLSMRKSIASYILTEAGA